MAGRAYEFGVGVAPDVSRAAQFYAEACEQIERGRSRLYGGDECYPGAMFALEGIGRDAPNLAEARSRLTIACQDESYEAQAACVQLGDMRRDGRGGPVDRAGAISAYRRAMQLDSTVRFSDYARVKLEGLVPSSH